MCGEYAIPGISWVIHGDNKGGGEETHNREKQMTRSVLNILANPIAKKHGRPGRREISAAEDKII